MHIASRSFCRTWPSIPSPRPQLSKPFCFCPPAIVAAAAGRSIKVVNTLGMNKEPRGQGRGLHTCQPWGNRSKDGNCKGREKPVVLGKSAWLVDEAALVFGEVVGRIITLLLKLKVWVFSFCAGYSAISTTCQGPAASSFGKHCFVLKQGWRKMERLWLFSFREHFVPSAVGKPCTDRSLFPEQKNWDKH